MKRGVCVLAFVMLFGIIGAAGPFLGLDLVPAYDVETLEGYWLPFIGGGYDTGWSLVTFGVNIQQALVLNGVYQLQVARLFPITETGNTRWGGILGAWVSLCNGYFDTGVVGIGPMATVQVQGMNLALKLFLFSSIYGDDTLFGLSPSISFWFDFMPRCAVFYCEPGCQAGW